MNNKKLHFKPNLALKYDFLLPKTIKIKFQKEQQKLKKH